MQVNDCNSTSRFTEGNKKTQNCNKNSHVQQGALSIATLPSMFRSWQLRYRCHGKPKRHQWWPWSGSFSWAPLAAGQNLKDIFKKNVSPDTVFYETWWNLKHIMIYYFILNWWSSEWHKCKLHLRMLRLRDSGDVMEISGADFDGLPCILRPCLFIFIYIHIYLLDHELLTFAARFTFVVLLFQHWRQKVFNFLALSDHGHPHVKEGSLCLTFGLNLEVYLLSDAYWNLCCYIDSILACPWV